MKMKRHEKPKQRILASVVMGINCVNSFAPMVAAVNMQPVRVATKPLEKTVAEPEQYTAACCQALDVVDNVIFGKAEAAFTQSVGTAYAVSSVNGETVTYGTQDIFAGGTATNGKIYYSGCQNVYRDATGSVIAVSDGGSQAIYSGGTGFVETLDRNGSQYVYSGGTGTVDTIYRGGNQIIKDGIGTATTISSGGFQTISAGIGSATTVRSTGNQNILAEGTGYVDMAVNAGQYIHGGTGFMNICSGGQIINSAGGMGSITTMKNGVQTVANAASGNIETMSAGSQTVSEDGIGTIKTMSGGMQFIYSGNGTVDVMSAGSQGIGYGIGTGTVNTMSGGMQFISRGGTGIVVTMSGGYQKIYRDGTGTIATMSGGSQTISSGGSGTIATMSGGSQVIGSSGIGTVNVMSRGIQTIDTNATGTVVAMSSGVQSINGGKGIVDTMSSGAQYIDNGSGTVANMSGGSQIIGANGIGNIDAMSAGLQDIYTGTGTVGTINDGSQCINSGGTGTVSALNGGQQKVFDEGTSLNTSVNGGILAVWGNPAVVKDTTIDAGKIIFNGNGADYRLSGDFIARGGMVDLTVKADDSTQTPATYETLTIDNLKGNGTTFLMNVDLNSETNGDKLVVEAADPDAGGSFQVYDKSLVDGTNVQGPKKLLMVTDNSGVTTWTGKSLDTGGLWTITPTIIKEGNDWYLNLSEKPLLPNDVAQTNIGFTNAAYGAWRNAVTDDTLRMRLGDLRYNDVEDGVWARAKAGKMDANGFAGSYQMYQVGMDKKLANTVYGVAIDHMVGSNDYLDGNGKNSMTNLNLYATNYHPSGVYSDVVVKAGKYRGDLNINSTNDAADYSAWGYSASYEIGKTIAKENGFFIEPEVQFVLGKLQGADYTSNEGISVDRDGSTSFLGRLGFVAGRKLSNAGDYYFKASVWREFAGSGDMNLSAVNNFGDKERMMESISHKDTWFEIGLGGNVKLAKKTYFYGDVVKTFGADIQKKWQTNVGVRFLF